MEFEVQSTFKRERNKSFSLETCGVWCPWWCCRGRKALHAGWGNPMPLATHLCVSGSPSLGSHKQLDMKLHYISFQLFKESPMFLLRGTCATSGKCVLAHYITVGPCRSTLRKHHSGNCFEALCWWWLQKSASSSDTLPEQASAPGAVRYLVWWRHQ